MGAFDDLIPDGQRKSVPDAPKQAPGLFDDLIPKGPVSPPNQRQAAVQRQPTELTLVERGVSALPPAIQKWLESPSVLGINLGRGSAIHGVMMGAADPVIGAAQIATLGQSSALNKAIDDRFSEYEAARKGIGREGFDAARLIGNVASPATYATARFAPGVQAVGLAGKALQGAMAGSLGGALAPVEHADELFPQTKLGQVAAGAMGGAVMAPVFGFVGEKILAPINRRSQAAINQYADDIMREGMDKLKREGVTLDPSQAAQIRGQVVDYLKAGRAPDAAALFRKGEFEALKIDPLLGQITRNSAQFSREKNLRGVAGAGDKILQRMDQGSTRLQELVSKQSAGAVDDYTAGRDMQSALKAFDEKMKSAVDAVGAMGRDHPGRAAPLPSGEFSQKAFDELIHGLWEGSLPSPARKILNDVTSGKIPLTVNSAVMMDMRLGELQRELNAAGKRMASSSVGVIRDALNSTSISDNVGADAKMLFDTMRSLALKRFKTHDAIPALEAAVFGKVPPEKFVQKYVIGGNADEVRELAKILPKPIFDETKRQLGAAMERAAFGANATGDKGFAQETYNRFINAPGMKQKLAEFFTKDELAQIYRIGRVGAYMTSPPANATVNTSGTAAALANLSPRIPGMPWFVGMLKHLGDAGMQGARVRSALAADPSKPFNSISKEQRELLARTLGAGGYGLANLTGAEIGRE